MDIHTRKRYTLPYTLIHTHAPIHTHSYTRTPTQAHTHTHTGTHTHTHIHTQTNTHTHTHIHTQTDTYSHTMYIGLPRLATILVEMSLSIPLTCIKAEKIMPALCSRTLLLSSYNRYCSLSDM